MLLIILLVMAFIGLVIIPYKVESEKNARLRKELGPNFDEEAKRYRNLMKDQIDRHF